MAGSARYTAILDACVLYPVMAPVLSHKLHIEQPRDYTAPGYASDGTRGACLPR